MFHRNSFTWIVIKKIQLFLTRSEKVILQFNGVHLKMYWAEEHAEILLIHLTYVFYHLNWTGDYFDVIGQIILSWFCQTAYSANIFSQSMYQLQCIYEKKEKILKRIYAKLSNLHDFKKFISNYWTHIPKTKHFMLNYNNNNNKKHFMLNYNELQHLKWLNINMWFT